MGIIDILQRERIYFNTNIFIYALEEFSEYIPLLRVLFKAVDQGIYHVYTSEFTLAEILVKPFIDNRPDLAAIYQEAVQATPFLTVTREILISSVRIRADLTNDKRLKAAQGPEIVLFDNLISRWSQEAGQ